MQTFAFDIEQMLLVAKLFIEFKINEIPYGLFY